ncbi:MAG: glycosyltransferase [Armatimonadota bacterium]|nr:glycosyltransferase [Armatimonadota bacterium]
MDLSLIIPTYNEADNVGLLAERIRQSLAGAEYEVIFVDDSTDGTDRVIAALSRQDARILLVHRENQRGLAAAVVEGIAQARGRTLCVLDADLQHPPEVILVLLDALQRAQADVVVASRYVPGGSYETFSRSRRLVSRMATLLARRLLHRARAVADPLSGFFVVRREVLEGVQLQPVGYKILLEILVRGRIMRVAEVPYRFHPRRAGQSKLTWRQHLDYLRHLARLVRVDPRDLRFVRFALVGASGVGVNMATFLAATAVGAPYLPAGAAAVVAATTWNFLWNDACTWPDVSPRTVPARLARYVRYWSVTGLGSVLHLAVLSVLVAAGLSPVLANLCGIGTAVLWNFRVNDRWTWRRSTVEVERVLFPVAQPVPDAAPDEPGLAARAFARRRHFVRHLMDGPIPEVRRSLGAHAGDPPAVSVIIPVAGPGRADNLGHLLAQLGAQTLQDFEVIRVVGDRRQGRAINTGAAAARGPILVTMDDDTRIGHPALLQRIVEAFATDPSLGIVGVANLVPPDAPWLVRRAMREIPRRSSAPVVRVVDSDMAEHPCLAIRREVFYAVGGEHEGIPRGLDPYLRREVRRLGYRVVVIPGVWIHHMLPETASAILRQYFRNGMGAAYVRKFYPQLVLGQAWDHGQEPVDRPLTVRVLRYAWHMAAALATARWIYLGTLVAYAAGYVRGLWSLRKDSL